MEKDFSELKELGLVKIVSEAFEDTDLFVSKDIFEASKKIQVLCDPTNVSLIVKSIRRHYISVLYEDYISRNTKKRQLPERNAILNVNADRGGSGNGFWAYSFFENGQKETYKVKDWIKKFDGVYSALFLYCDNPGGWLVNPRKSAVLHPESDIYIKEALDSDRDPPIRLFIPGKIKYVE